MLYTVQYTLIHSSPFSDTEGPSASVANIVTVLSVYGGKNLVEAGLLEVLTMCVCGTIRKTRRSESPQPL